MMKNPILFWIMGGGLLLCTLPMFAQKTFPVQGIRDVRSNYYAFQHAALVTRPGSEIKGGTLIIKSGKIEYAGPLKNTPPGAVEVDCHGRYIYPSFIDLDSDYGLQGAVADINKKLPGPRGWNAAMKTDFEASEHFVPDTGKQNRYLEAGFGTVLTHRHDGISRGGGALVFVGDLPVNAAFLKARATHHLSFKKGRSKQKYPGSLMGVIALIRQTYYDGQWYKKKGYQEETNTSLEAWNNRMHLPQIFETDHFLDIFRAHKLEEEFHVEYIYRGSGEEYRRASEIAGIARRIILPLKYPKPIDLRNPLKGLYPSYAEMKHWEWAPFNASVLADAGVELAFSMHGIDSPKSFKEALVKTVAHNLDEAAALEALTIHPAKWLGVFDRVGTLEKGKFANFIIADGSPFLKGTIVMENWVKGKRHLLPSPSTLELSGQYQLSWGGQTYSLKVTKTSASILQATIDTISRPVQIRREGNLVSLSFEDASRQFVRLEGQRLVNGDWEGTGLDAQGHTKTWRAEAVREVSSSDERLSTSSADTALTPPPIEIPFTAYGWSKLPEQKDYLIRHATVWTNTDQGILKDADVLISKGKITQVGKGINAPSSQTVLIDATGMHLTTGIIDEHSHIAITRGVNECTQAVTAEVRIGDVINSEDINIYRQLAGGVTASQLLHGSCNPIGGQSAIIKLRWGHLPEALKIRGADPFIKFALGENVKRSYSGKNTRYPNTRMGVAQIYDDAFTAAADYWREKTENAASTRVDLEMEAIAEILHSKRFVTCHSYVQSEINMLMHTAVDHGFRVNTFTHGLEAYKVADKIKAHGAGVSTFSDWWAYKFEVKDAIPYNPALLVKMGVTTAINSDDAEMGRRLNQEAAKAVKYGGLSPEEAWKTVTLNPAKLLHLDDRMGTIEGGKDADVVLWNHSPLSIYALPQATWVDGVKYYDIRTQKKMSLRMESERNRIAQRMLREVAKTGKSQPPKIVGKHDYHCDDAEDEGGIQ